jgi:integrase
MSKSNPAPRRERVERNIYRRPTGVFEVGFKDGAGVQRWRTVEGGITAARVLRDELLARRGRGERVAPNPRLRFGEASEKWLDGPVRDLRATTQAGYRNAVERHLRPRFSTRRMDTLTPDDLAVLVRDLRAEGLSEASIVVVLGVTGRIYRYAARRLGWSGTNPVALMLPSERPKPSRAQRRRIFEGQELEQTIAAAHEPHRTMLTVAALTGGRISELCGLTWADVGLDDLADAEIEFGWQVDRKGNRTPTKTDGSARTVPIPRALAVILARHKLASRISAPDGYVFATRTGRPLSQRNVARALRTAQRAAVDEDGRPTFPALHERDANGKPVKVPRGLIPSMHSFRHTVASRALLAGESVDEIAFLLGHRDANVTRAVYVRELADTRRRAMRRTRMAAEFDGALRAGAEEDSLDPQPRPLDGQVRELRGGPSAATPSPALVEA